MLALVGGGEVGNESLIQGSVVRAFASGDAAALVETLAALGAAGCFGQELFPAPNPVRYSRSRLWTDPDGRFTVACMTWLPGQGTPVHDHAGRWGAELVVRGVMLETGYRIDGGTADGRVRLAVARTAILHPAEAGAIIPAADIHAQQNVSNDVAHTVHVYSSLADVCTKFTAAGDEWGTPARVAFTYA